MIIIMWDYQLRTLFASRMKSLAKSLHWSLARKTGEVCFNLLMIFDGKV